MDSRTPEVWSVTVRRNGKAENAVLVIDGRTTDPTDRIVANAARQLTRRLGGGRPTRPEEGGR